MGCDLSLESSWNEDGNDMTFVCLTCCWQPVGNLSVQMFAKSQKYKMFTVSRKYGLWPIIGMAWNEDRNDVTFVCLTCCWQPVGNLSVQMFAKSQKYKMFIVSRKYGLWPIIGIIMKWGSQWCDFCVPNLLLTACWQPKHANVCKITKNIKFSPLVKSMGCDLSLEWSWNEDRNDVTFVSLICCWQPVGSLRAQMFANHKNTKCSPLVGSMSCDLSLESSWNEDHKDLAFLCLMCLTCC